MIGKEHEKVTIGNIRLDDIPAKNDLTIVIQDKRKKDMITKETLTHARIRKWRELHNSRRCRPVSPIELRELVDGGAAEGRRAWPCGMRHNATAFDRPPFFFWSMLLTPWKHSTPNARFPIRTVNFSRIEKNQLNNI